MVLRVKCARALVPRVNKLALVGVALHELIYGWDYVEYPKVFRSVVCYWKKMNQSVTTSCNMHFRLLAKLLSGVIPFYLAVFDILILNKYNGSNQRAVRSTGVSPGLPGLLQWSGAIALACCDRASAHSSSVCQTAHRSLWTHRIWWYTQLIRWIQ